MVINEIPDGSREIATTAFVAAALAVNIDGGTF